MSDNESSSSSDEFNDTPLTIDLTDKNFADPGNEKDLNNNLKSLDQDQPKPNQNTDLFKEIYFNKSKKLFNIEICFKLEELINQSLF